MTNPDDRKAQELSDAKSRRDAFRFDTMSAEMQEVGTSFDKVLSALTDELTLGPDVTTPSKSYSHPAEAQRDLGVLEAQLRDLDAALSIHERHALEWQRRAMLAIKEGRDDLAKDALERYGEARDVAETLTEETRMLGDLIANYKVVITTLEHEIPRDLLKTRPVTALRWGLIGTGDIARKRIAPALRDLPMCDFVAVCRGRAELAEAFAKEFGAATWYASVPELLADPDIDAVYLATPVHLHAGQTIAAAKAGKHVLCEKPMAMNAAECDAMIAACTENGVALGVAYYRHFYPSVARIKDIIAAGEIGTVVMAQINVFEAFNPPPGSPRSWLLEKGQSGGGPMLDFGCHRIEVLVNLFGPVSEVQSVVGNVVLKRGVEDTAIALLSFEQGGYATLSVTHAASEPQDTLDIFGSEGSIHVAALNQGAVRIRSRSGERLESLPPAPNLHAPQIEEFVAAVQAGRAPGVSGEMGRVVTHIEDQIYARTTS